MDPVQRGEVAERLLLGAPIQVILRQRAPAERPLRIVFEHGDDPIVLVEGEPAQDNGIHHGEDRRAGADPEREHHQRDGGEGRGLSQRSHGIPHVVADPAAKIDRPTRGAVFGNQPRKRVAEGRERRARERRRAPSRGAVQLAADRVDHIVLEARAESGRVEPQNRTEDDERQAGHVSGSSATGPAGRREGPAPGCASPTPARACRPR